MIKKIIYNKFKIFIFILLILITSSNIYSYNISTLINNYNFSYKNSQLDLNLTNYSIINNSLNLDLDLIYKNSSLIFILGTFNNNLKTNKIIFRNITNGLNKLNFSFDLNYLKNQKYFIYFRIYEKNENIFRKNHYLILNISHYNSTNNSNSIFNLNFSLYNKNSSQKYFLINMSKNISSNFQIKKLKFSSKNNFLPDISIFNISYNKSNGNLNLSLKNIGKKIMPTFLISIFDENSTLISENIQKIVLVNQSLNLIFNISKNNSKLFIYLDYYNQYLEIFKYNNFLSWPVNLTEICFDNIDNNRNGLVDENCKIKVLKKIIHTSGGSSHNSKIIKNIQNNNSNKSLENNNSNNLKINNFKNNISIIRNNSNFTFINISKKNKINYSLNPIFKKNNLIEKSFYNRSLNSNNNFFNSHKLTISSFLAGIIFIILNFLFN